MARQLAFDLPVRSALGRDAFFVSPSNATALAAVESWETWPDLRHLLIGPEGSGKTHLVHVWASLSGARMLAAADLSETMVPDIVRQPAVAIEDVDRGADEPALFHLMNLAKAERVALLLTARTFPGDWRLALPDLASRVAALPVARLEPPDDGLLSAVLVKLFDDRQLAVAPGVIDYVASRIERSFAAARGVVSELDAAALARQSAVTVPLARAILDNPASENT